MRETKNRATVFVPLVLILLVAMAGCAHTSAETPVLHTCSTFHEAVPASFFCEGRIAYYECETCGQTLDAQKAEVDTVTLPKLSTDLSLCVNGQPSALTLAEQSDERLIWSLEHLKLAQGDTVTVCDTSDRTVVYSCSVRGNLDENGRIKAPASDAVVSLIATPDALVLSVGDDLYRGVVAQINGRQYPMHYVSYQDTDAYTYVYGYVQLKAGDALVLVDTVNDITYGFDALSEEHNWNIYDYHRGENGELVIDCDARYALEFGRGGDDRLRITKAFGPSDGSGYSIVFDSGKQAVPMKELPLDPELFREYLWYAAHENTMNGSDIAGCITEKGLYSYSTVLHLEEGAGLRIENTAAAQAIPVNHLAEAAGAAECFRLSGDAIEIVQSGTYHIRYIPAYGTIALDRLSPGGIAEAAKELDKKIVLLPSNVELYYADEIRALYREYLLLADHLKPLLKAAAKLEAMYQGLLEAEQSSARVIYYMNPADTKQVYQSKEALSRAFFTDFYYYIAVYHGTAGLEGYGVRNVRDFLAMAGDPNGAGLTEFCGIGYAACEYFLRVQRNGVLENQTENAFLGFCYHNGLYQDLLRLFSNFFSYWRIDEGLANPSNYYADMFAESWSPTVDMAKFLYYDAETSGVETERVMDCFNNAASVIYGFDSTDPLPDIRLRGYIFEGWYDNPECTGSPVTRLELTGETLRLYAKWRVDEDRRDADSAALVDNYIYNLTTQESVRNATTVAQVKAMYDSLSVNAKQLVKRYDTLENLVRVFQ